jgi:hypothetical protein
MFFQTVLVEKVSIFGHLGAVYVVYWSFPIFNLQEKNDQEEVELYLTVTLNICYRLTHSLYDGKYGGPTMDPP